MGIRLGEAVRYFRSTEPVRTSDLLTTLGLLTAKTFAGACRGTIEFTEIARRGSVIQTVLPEPPVEPYE